MGKVIGAIPMRGSMVGLLAVALLCEFGMSIAKPIVYNVNISDATQTISGTLTTDGALGALAPSDITAWHLTAVGRVSFSIASSDVGAFLSCAGIVPPTCGLGVIDSSVILGAFPGSDAIFGAQVRPGPGPTFAFVQFRANQPPVGVGPELPTILTFIPLDLPVVVAVAVPEIDTSTGLLLGLAFTGLCFARKRVQAQQATAV